MIFYSSLLIIIICIVMSLRQLFIPNKIKGNSISFENFVFLAFIYATVVIGFGLIYMMLEINGYTVFDDYLHSESDYFSRLETSLYFSAVTLFSVGYGDIAPLGIGRAIAVTEALIGFTIPAAFVARAVLDWENN